MEYKDIRIGDVFLITQGEAKLNLVLTTKNK